MAEEGIGKRVLEKGWLAGRSTEVDLTGVDLTTTNPPSAQQSPWMEAIVPGTVLTTLVKNNLVHDPFYGLENETIIDIGESGREYFTFWFFTTFECKLSTNQHVDLNFRAINYSADVYLNGHKEVLPKGMFRRHCIGVTDMLNPDGKNLLAVLVYPPDHPGKFLLKVVKLVIIRDRNTGIWVRFLFLLPGTYNQVYEAAKEMEEHRKNTPEG